jgi:hypothetical protein
MSLGVVLLGLAAGASDAQAIEAAQAMDTLSDSVAGRTIIRRAANALTGGDTEALTALVEPGRVSEAIVATRRSFDGRTTQKSRSVRIQLESSADLLEAATGLAHELVHAASSNIDAYEPHLTAGNYVRQAIDGPGGEVEAVLVQCEVERELVKRGVSGTSHCDALEELSQNSVREKLWSTGSYHSEARAALGNEADDLPLSSDSADMVSALEGTPYPLALAHAYAEMNRNVCDNTAAQLRSLDDDNGPTARVSRELMKSRCSE